MNALTLTSKSNWIRSFTILLLIGLLLPVSPASAKIYAQDANPFAKHLIPNGMRSQNQAAPVNIVPLAGPNLIQDPSFEASFGSSAFWAQSSTNFGTPVCPSTAPAPAGCGNGGG